MYLPPPQGAAAPEDLLPYGEEKKAVVRKSFRQERGISHELQYSRYRRRFQYGGEMGAWPIALFMGETPPLRDKAFGQGVSGEWGAFCRAFLEQPPK